MKILKDKFPKKEIEGLPRVQFPGRIFIIQSAAETDRAVDYLLRQPILGLDTETRPCFKKGLRHKVSLLQISTHDTCFLFRLNLMKQIPESLIHLLEDCSVTKVGLSFHDDIRALSQRGTFTPGIYVELQKEVKELGIEDMSLQKLYANLLGGKIAKSQQLSNWDADSLSSAQQMYAATDAWACIMLHEEIKQLISSHDYEVECTETEENQTFTVK